MMIKNFSLYESMGDLWTSSNRIYADWREKWYQAFRLGLISYDEFEEREKCAAEALASYRALAKFIMKGCND